MKKAPVISSVRRHVKNFFIVNDTIVLAWLFTTEHKLMVRYDKHGLTADNTALF